MINKEEIKLQKKLKNIPDNQEIQNRIRSLQKELQNYKKGTSEFYYINNEIDYLSLKELGYELFINIVDSSSNRQTNNSTIPTIANLPEVEVCTTMWD